MTTRRPPTQRGPIQLLVSSFRLPPVCRLRSILTVSSPPQKERAKNLKPQDRGRTQDEVGRVAAGVEAGRNAEGDEGRNAEGDEGHGGFLPIMH